MIALAKKGDNLYESSKAKLRHQDETCSLTQDLKVRHLLFLKGAALGNLDACKLTYYEKKGFGETSDFAKEIELLLFDM